MELASTMREPPEIRQLGPIEMQDAHAALLECQRLNTEREAADKRIDSIELDMGRLLVDVIAKDWCRSVLGKTTKDWAFENLKGRNGEALSEGNVNSLAAAYKTIHSYPAIESLLRTGDKDGKRPFSRTAAYYACATADLHGWAEANVKKYLDQHGISSETVEEAKTFAEQETVKQILGLLYKYNSKRIRGDYYCSVQEQRIAEKEGRPLGTAKEWVRVKGSVQKEVHVKWEKTIQKLLTLQEELIPPEQLSLTRQFEQLSTFVDDTLYALDQAVAGNPKPIESLIVQAQKAQEQWT